MKWFTLLVALVIAACAGDSNPDGMSDEQRICDAVSIAKVVEEFHARAGFYPYEESFLEPEEGYVAVPGMVNIYRGSLPERYRYPPSGISGYVDSLASFEEYLSEYVADVKLPVDDREVNERSAPTFYQYIFNGQRYIVSAILVAERPGTIKLGDGHYKYSVSSEPVPSDNIRSLADASVDCGI